MTASVLQYSAEELVLFALRHEGSAASFFGVTVIQSRSSDDLKRLYKRLALKLHPDKNEHPDAGRAFQVLQTHFEATLASFSTEAAAPPPPPAAKPAASRTAPPPPRASQAHPPPSSHQYPPPPPPQSSSQRSQKKPPVFEDDDIPLPPDVFDDLAWDDWSDQLPKGASGKKHSNASSASTMPPPPPPPPQRHGQSSGAAWPPPPPPPRSSQPNASPTYASRQADEPAPYPYRHAPAADAETSPPRRAKSSRTTTESALPSLDSEGDDTSPTVAQGRGSKGATRMSGMPSLSDGSSDDGDYEQEAKRRARRKREEQEAAARREADLQAKRIANAAKSLKHLFAAFDISDDDGDAHVVRSDVKHKHTSSRSAQQPAASTASPTAPVPTNPFYQQPVSHQHRPTSSSVTASAARVKATPPASSSAVAGGFAVCPSCGCGTVPVSPFGGPTAAVQCHQCRHYFSPMSSSSGGSKKKSAEAPRCSCGKAKKGHCFMCGD